MKTVIMCSACCLFILSMNLYLLGEEKGYFLCYHIKNAATMKVWFCSSYLFLLLSVIYSLFSKIMALYQFEFTVMGLVILAVIMGIVILHYLHIVDDAYFLAGAFNVCWLVATFIIFSNLKPNG